MPTQPQSGITDYATRSLKAGSALLVFNIILWNWGTAKSLKLFAFKGTPSGHPVFRGVFLIFIHSFHRCSSLLSAASHYFCGSFCQRDFLLHGLKKTSHNSRSLTAWTYPSKLPKASALLPTNLIRSSKFWAECPISPNSVFFR